MRKSCAGLIKSKGHRAQSLEASGGGGNVKPLDIPGFDAAIAAGEYKPRGLPITEQMLVTTAKYNDCGVPVHGLADHFGVSADRLYVALREWRREHPKGATP